MNKARKYISMVFHQNDVRTKTEKMWSKQISTQGETQIQGNNNRKDAVKLKEPRKDTKPHAN